MVAFHIAEQAVIAVIAEIDEDARAAFLPHDIGIAEGLFIMQSDDLHKRLEKGPKALFAFIWITSFPYAASACGKSGRTS